MHRNPVGRRSIVTEPSEEPVTLTEVRDHTRVEISDDDLLLQNQITAAREHLERATNRAFVTQTWKVVLDEFPDGNEPIVLPKPPLRAVNSVKYTTDDGTTSTFAASNYIVDTDSEPGRVEVKRNNNWPTETLQTANGVEVEFDAGYGGQSDVPQRIKQAILLLVAHWYENREAVTSGQENRVPREVERALGDLVTQNRVRMLA